MRNCKAIIPIAEGIKKKLEQKYQIEYDLWLKEKVRDICLGDRLLLLQELVAQKFSTLSLRMSQECQH